MFWVRYINEYANSVTGFIEKCIDDVIPMVSFKTDLDQNPWIDVSLVEKLKERDAVYEHGLVTGTIVGLNSTNTAYVKWRSNLAGRTQSECGSGF